MVEGKPVISKRVVTLAIAATTAGTLPVFLTGALSVQIRASLHLNKAATGFLVALFFASATVTSLTSGRLAEKIGSEMVMKVATALAGINLIGITLFASSFLWMAVFLAIAGMSNGALQPSVNMFVAGAIPPSRQGFAFGIKQAAIPTATLLAGLAVPLVALTIGWRFAYLAAGIFAFVISFAIPKRTMGHVRLPSSVSASEDFSVAPLVMLAFAMALGAGAANAMGAYLVENAVHVGFNPGDAGLLVVIGSISGLIARLYSGHRADQRSHGHFKVTAAMVGIGAVGYFMFASQAVIFLIPATVVGYAAGWGWNGLYNFAVVKNHPNAPGRATGITQSGAYVGSVVGPIAFGIVVQDVSFSAAWVGAAVLAGLSSIFMVVGRNMLIRSRQTLSPG